MNICSQCQSTAVAKGLCRKHYSAQHYIQTRKSEPRVVMTSEERKASQLESAKRWRESNREKHRAASKRCRETPEGREAHRLRQIEYAKLNREQARARAAKWREENPDKALAGKRRYYVENREKIVARNKRHREANKSAYLMYSRLYKAKKRASGEYVHPDFIGLLLIEQGSKCACCDAPFSDVEYHVDHVVALSAGGMHEHNNLQLLCGTCNRRKSAKPLMTFLMVLEAERGRR